MGNKFEKDMEKTREEVKFSKQLKQATALKIYQISHLQKKLLHIRTFWKKRF